MARNHHRTYKGDRLIFDDRKYLIDLFKIWTPETRGLEVVIKKGPQEGVSEFAICLAFTMAGEYGQGVYYVMPKYDLRDKFVQERINRTIMACNRYSYRLQQAPGAADSLHMKHFGVNGTLIFVGSNVPGDFVSFTVDLAIIDEVNQCDSENLGMIEDRQAGHTSKRNKVLISTPTVENKGISYEYEMSDQRKWFIPCPNCGEWQAPTWYEHVMRPGSLSGAYQLADQEWVAGSPNDIRILCKFCDHPMNRLVDGEWRPTNQGSPTVGFHITKIISAATRILDCYKLYRKGLNNPRNQQLFWNYIGEDFSAEGSKITDKVMEEAASISPYPRPSVVKGACTAGVDVGKILNMVIDSYDHDHRRRLVFGDSVPLDLNTVVDLWAKYNVRCAVIDCRPETDFVRRLKERLNTPGKTVVWSCEYLQDNVREPRWDYVEAHVQIDRTTAMDRSFAALQAGARLLPTDWRNIDGGAFAKQMKVPTRVLERRQKRDVWVWDKGVDHYRHADTYAWLASTIGGGQGEGGFDLGQPKLTRQFSGPEAHMGIGAKRGRWFQ